jgi:hypothetical protein
MSPVLPPIAGRHFPAGSIRDAERLLAAGRVDEPAFFRLGLAGRVVAPNGRSVTAFLVLERGGGLLSATCSCTPHLLPGQLCAHLAALALSASGRSRGVGAPLLPGERFEASIWFKVAETSFGLPGGGTAEGAPGAAPTAELSPLRPFERRLVDLTRTTDERLLNSRGATTQRQAFEASVPFLVAKRAFEAFGEDLSGAGVERTGAGLSLVAHDGPREFRLGLAEAAIEVLRQEDPRFFRDRGVDDGGRGRESLRLSVETDGSLVLTPVLLLASGGEEEALPQETVAARAGRYLLLRDPDRLVSLDATRRPFAERSAQAQAGFDFDETWRPSPLGVPLDRPTRIPPGEAASFLARHRAELSEWPADLLPAELRGGGLAEPEGAVLTVLGEENGCFVLRLEYLFGSGRVGASEIAEARRSRSPLQAAAGRLLDPQDARFGWMDLVGKGALRGKGASARLTLAPLEVCRLRSYLPVEHALERVDGVCADALERLERLSPESPAPPPEKLGVPLYDFQRTGYAWLWFLYRAGFGGLLCDDMGLGKTHQVMALFAAVVAETRQLPRILVVAPASVLPHWEEKLRTHLSRIPVTVHHGGGRGPAAPRGGVLLATYGTLRNDAPSLSAETFDLFVLDEIQSIKNRGTATHQALRTLKARVAVGMTGTPVENRVEELHALVDFVLPGYLPGEAAFRKTFAQPIADGDEAAKERLRRLVRPFVLRRTKEQVAVGLPEKIEDRRTCEMTAGQAAIYRDLVAGAGAPLHSALAGEGPVSVLHVFALLDRLKQVLDHPDLLLPAGSKASGETSGKWELFQELLSEALGSGLKVVVFSQYLRMLDRIEAHLDGLGVVHAGLRGATLDRAAPVARFHGDPACRVFVASLKAAGLGIDLTPASVVVHYDRWWNRAREDQATDRVHRIGQKRGVQVLTLVTRGTVEERIDRLIAAKARLAADLVPEEDPRLFRRFTRDELRQLLEP